MEQYSWRIGNSFSYWYHTTVSYYEDLGNVWVRTDTSTSTSGTKKYQHKQKGWVTILRRETFSTSVVFRQLESTCTDKLSASVQHATSTRRLLATKGSTTSGYRNSEGPLPSTSQRQCPENKHTTNPQQIGGTTPPYSWQIGGRSVVFKLATAPLDLQQEGGEREPTQQVPLDYDN